MSTPQVESVVEVANEVKEAVAITEIARENGPIEPEMATTDSQSAVILTDGTSDPPPDNSLLPNNKNGSTHESKKNRRVCFPADSNVVSGYMDPPSPWHDASSCSTDELLGAYRQSCDKHGVRPLAKVMQQLMVVNDFCDRNEMLTLRGEHLDLRHCETLEEVLRRVQFRTLDLECTRLDEEGAVALFDMIEYYESCNKLNISYNKNLGVRGWQACARMLKKTPCIEYFEARGCTISEQVMPFVGRALRLGSMVTTLHLENAIMSGRPLMILVAAIKMNEMVRELFLADNKLMPSDGIQLGNMLKFNHRLQLLDVRNNHLQDVGTSHICDGLWEQNLDHGLNTLVLWNNQITYQAMPALSRALINTHCLETLNLGHNNLTTEGVHRLKEGLLQNKSLLRIGLQAAKITCEGAVALAEFIAESPRLVRMDLRENDIKTAGLMALSLSLKVSQSVTRIDLDKDPKREPTMKDYAEQQKRLLNDISNYMLRNRDLARQREEEEERQRIEQERAVKQLEEAQREDGQENEEPPEQPQTEEQIEAEKSEEKKKVCEEEKEKEDSEHDTENDNNAKKLENVHIECVENSSPSRNLKLDLKPAFVNNKSSTLESPAFVPESQLPIIRPPTDDNLGAIMEDKDAEALLRGELPGATPKEFPPSPMVSSDGHAMLAPVLASPTVSSPSEATAYNIVYGSGQGPAGQGQGQATIITTPPPLSPNTKRKFRVSRVQEGNTSTVAKNLSTQSFQNIPAPSLAGCGSEMSHSPSKSPTVCHGLPQPADSTHPPQSHDTTVSQPAFIVQNTDTCNTATKTQGSGPSAVQEGSENGQSSCQNQAESVLHTNGNSDTELKPEHEQKLEQQAELKSETVSVVQAEADCKPETGVEVEEKAETKGEFQFKSEKIETGGDLELKSEIGAEDKLNHEIGAEAELNPESGIGGESLGEGETLSMAVQEASSGADTANTSTGDQSAAQPNKDTEDIEGDLHTTLGLNGMRAELASALDDINIKIVSDKTEETLDTLNPAVSVFGDGSSADDFERELDEMIASVTGSGFSLTNSSIPGGEESLESMLMSDQDK